ncbi:MAG: DinB family protein [bacterium]
MRQQQRTLHESLRSQTHATRQRVADLVRPLDLARLVEHPEPNAWSVADVLEHLCRTEDAYRDHIRAAIAGARADAGAPAREWKSSLIGGLIAESLIKPKPLKAPRVFRPGPTPRNGVLECFLAQELTLLKYMDDAASLDWTAVRIGSPALYAFMPKLNLGDVFRVHVVHANRHAGQIERVAKKLRAQ